MNDVGRRWLIISPHLDDAVFSAGAAMAANVRAGGSTTVVTLLAGDPASVAPAGPWDVDSGFGSAAAAATARRVEDETACRILGAEPVHLDGTDEQYGIAAGERALWDVVRRLADEHDLVFLPASPLRHHDHRRLATNGAEVIGVSERLRLYGEEPYLLYRRQGPRDHALPTGQPIRWWREPASLADATRKLRAARAYRSQLELLARPLERSRFDPAVLRMLTRLYVRARRGEWLGEPA